MATVALPRRSSNRRRKRRLRSRRRTCRRSTQSSVWPPKRSGSAAGSGVARVRMAEPAESGRVGRADTASDRRRKRPTSRVADAVQRLGRDEAKALAEELLALWRGDSSVGDRVAARLAGIFREVGLVTREELDEAELKIAQLEHRLRLLEDGRPPLSPPAP